MCSTASLLWRHELVKDRETQTDETVCRPAFRGPAASDFCDRCIYHAGSREATTIKWLNKYNPNEISR
jgi:hypothetical protein